MIAIGSGFVVHESGFFITNAHAVERVISYHATLTDGRKYPAELVGVSREYDLALLKVSAGRKLHPVQLGKSGDFILGETIVVISNPGGLLHTCTTGIISAASRRRSPAPCPASSLRSLMQTDATINPGSSGGPWFNVLGEVVGVTTALQPGSPISVSAFPPPPSATPCRRCSTSSDCYSIFTGLAHPGTCRRSLARWPRWPPVRRPPWPASAPATSSSRRRPARSSAAANSSMSLIGHKPGDVLNLQLLRADEPVEVSLKLGARPKPNGDAILQEKFGMAAKTLSPEMVRGTAMRVEHGVMITDVAKGPPYNRLQTPPKPGDILARVNNIRPRDMDHLGLLLDRIKPGDTVHFVFLHINPKDRTASR